MVTSIINRDKTILKRPLLENNSNSFIRFNKAVCILHKIQKKKEKTLDNIISSRKPFGFATNFTEYSHEKFTNAVKLYAQRQDIGYVSKNKISNHIEWIDKYKVLISRAYGERGAFPYLVLGKPFLGEPNSCCTETYIVMGPYHSKKEAENVISYIKTRFFRFLVLLKKNTQDAPARVYSFVPIQDFSESWTDEKLYAKYNLTQEEIAFIESMIRPMD